MTHASVFSGIGGPEVAATMLGWENLFHCEINPFGRKVLDYWYPNSKSYEDITTTDFTEWRGRVDVLTGGFPCQPFSYAGRRRGAEDDRYLWPSMYRAIDEIQPTWVVAENVAGILTMVEQGEVSKVAGTASLFDAFDDLRGRYELRETFTLQRICSDLESHGYAVQPVLIPACAVGAPHRRDRVFIVARRVEAVSEDTMHGRQLHRPNEEQRSERNERHTCAGGGERICGEYRGLILPTPTAIEGVKWTNTWNPNSQMGQSLSAMAGSGMLPTPVGTDWQGCYNEKSMKMHNGRDKLLRTLPTILGVYRPTTEGGKHSRLSPLFTEEMMGFPLMWTALPFLSESGAPKPSKPTATPSSPK